MVLQYVHCKSCDTTHKWYISCCFEYSKKNFTNWTSGNENIDNFIRKEQLKIGLTFVEFRRPEYKSNDVVFEWIPYDQFSNIQKIGRIHSALWKDGPLKYNKNTGGYERNQNEVFALKYY